MGVYPSNQFETDWTSTVADKIATAATQLCITAPEHRISYALALFGCAFTDDQPDRTAETHHDDKGN